MEPRPIVHISIPVADIDESVSYYETVLSCAVGRRTSQYADVWFFGAQLTLVNADNRERQRHDGAGYERHFGAVVSGDRLELLRSRVVEDARSTIISGPTSAHVGTPLEQTKFMFRDLDGHAIELKAYTDVNAALALPARANSQRPPCDDRIANDSLGLDVPG